jgi:anti-sigma factor RsiW
MEMKPPTEEDLHAYLDGELADDRRRMVQAWLRQHPDDATRLEAYRADGVAIARIFGRAGDLPVPAIPSAPSPAMTGAARRDGVTARWWARAAAVALIVAGALTAAFIGLRQDDRGEETAWARFAAEAAAAHLSLADQHERPAVSASLRDISDYLSAQLKKRLNLRDPSASAYRLVGSRFVTSADKRVPQLAFMSSDGELVTMYLEAWPGKKDAPFREMTRRAELVTLVWVDDEIGCAVSGTLPPAELEQVARQIYGALIG